MNVTQCRKITQYQTVFGPDTEALDKSAGELIGNGWQPYGSPYATGTSVCQAMVSYDPYTTGQLAAPPEDLEPEPEPDDPQGRPQ